MVNWTRIEFSKQAMCLYCCGIIFYDISKDNLVEYLIKYHINEGDALLVSKIFENKLLNMLHSDVKHLAKKIRRKVIASIVLLSLDEESKQDINNISNLVGADLRQLV